MREKEFLPNIKEKLGIESLNPMQIKMMESTSQSRDIILLSPTGSGKTLAFILPMLKMLKPSTGRVQCIIIAPARELVLQIAGIVRAVASGFKTTTLYGGHKVEDEVNSLNAGADIIVATPGRLLDHITRRNIDVMPTRILVLDEFDKSLELGFEKEMKKIVDRLKNVSRIILTSATKTDILPDFLKLTNPLTLNYLDQNSELKDRLRVHRVESSSADKLEALCCLLQNLAYEKGDHPRSIVFVNHRESAERTANYLKRHGIPAVLYHGAMDQRDREKAIAMFNNGSRPVLVATDLAARGLDIEGVNNVIHYHQPLTEETYTHRNGRTARVDNTGDVFVLTGPDEDIKEYIDFDTTRYLDSDKQYAGQPQYETLYFSAGKREKLSKGDILGFLVKEGGLSADQIGKIDVYDHYALAAVDRNASEALMKNIKNKKIKGEKRLISLID
ncbi:MAG: DEAD/DEAH box helicase [Bacteroides sp.]|nr:DEAD/DEAH box helicase [Bacteroidales bacterium]MBD5302147.1 DEAD/DEAH box helicase [Bacteroides sp.]